MANRNDPTYYTPIGQTLRQIRASVAQKRLTESTKAKGERIGDPSAASFWDGLARQEALLRRLLRQLVGRQTTFEHERSHLWRIPRDQRYSARQSLAAREAINLDLVELAELTLRELLQFAGDIASMKPGDWESLAEEVANLADKIDIALTHTVVQQMQKGPAFSAANAHPGLGVEHLAPLVGLLIALIARRRRRAPANDTKV